MWSGGWGGGTSRNCMCRLSCARPLVLPPHPPPQPKMKMKNVALGVGGRGRAVADRANRNVGRM